MSCSALAAGFRAHREWLRETTAQLDQLLVPLDLCPLAVLLVACHTSGILREKWSPTAGDVPAFFRCTACYSPQARMKGLQAIAEGLGPITGFRLRCRTCGAPNTFRVEELELELDTPRPKGLKLPRRGAAPVSP